MTDLKQYIHYGPALERVILGACLLDKSALGRTYGLLEPECFYVSSHRVVYEVMKELYDYSLPIDIETVIERIVAQKGIEELEGHSVPYFITGLTYSVVSSAHLEYHCHLVKEMWRRRRILEIKYEKLEDDLDPRKNIQEINEKIREVLGTDIKKDWYDLTDLMFELMKHQAEMAKGKRTFITTGFQKADNLNGGFYNGQMIVIGARPSVGKSALMGQMALKMARSGKKVGIISLEMNNTEIAARLSSLETGIEFSRVFRDIANDEALHSRFYDKISKDTINLPIYISDKTKVNINEIRAKAIKLKSTKGCDCLMIDYLQLVDSHTENRNYNREQEVAKMSRGIKLMAMELDIPVIILCQLNRQVTARSYKDRFPKLSDLRESGAIEQDGDIVWFLHRDYMSGWQQDEQGVSTEKRADLICPKWRNGATFHLELDFDPPKMRFSERQTLMQYKPIVDASQEDNPF